MKYVLYGIAIIAVAFVLLRSRKQSGEAWTKDQLMEPSELVAQQNSGVTPQPLIFSMGPAGTIKGAVEIGPASEKENLDALQAKLSGVSKDQTVVVYCGCCPFDNCPNVRPAMNLLNSLGFKNAKLLNLSTNLKTDWIDKGYPMN